VDIISTGGTAGCEEGKISTRDLELHRISEVLEGRVKLGIPGCTAGRFSSEEREARSERVNAALNNRSGGGQSLSFRSDYASQRQLAEALKTSISGTIGFAARRRTTIVTVVCCPADYDRGAGKHRHNKGKRDELRSARYKSLWQTAESSGRSTVS